MKGQISSQSSELEDFRSPVRTCSPLVLLVPSLLVLVMFTFFEPVAIPCFVAVLASEGVVCEHERCDYYRESEKSTFKLT